MRGPIGALLDALLDAGIVATFLGGHDIAVLQSRLIGVREEHA